MRKQIAAGLREYDYDGGGRRHRRVPCEGLFYNVLLRRFVLKKPLCSAIALLLVVHRNQMRRRRHGTVYPPVALFLSQF